MDVGPVLAEDCRSACESEVSSGSIMVVPDVWSCEHYVKCCGGLGGFRWALEGIGRWHPDANVERPEGRDRMR